MRDTRNGIRRPGATASATRTDSYHYRDVNAASDDDHASRWPTRHFDVFPSRRSSFLSLKRKTFGPVESDVPRRVSHSITFSGLDNTNDGPSSRYTSRHAWGGRRARRPTDTDLPRRRSGYGAMYAGKQKSSEKEISVGGKIKCGSGSDDEPEALRKDPVNRCGPGKKETRRNDWSRIGRRPAETDLPRRNSSYVAVPAQDIDAKRSMELVHNGNGSDNEQMDRELIPNDGDSTASRGRGRTSWGRTIWSTIWRPTATDIPRRRSGYMAGRTGGSTEAHRDANESDSTHEESETDNTLVEPDVNRNKVGSTMRSRRGGVRWGQNRRDLTATNLPRRRSSCVTWIQRR